MKTLFLISFFFFSLSIFPQWIQQNSGTTNLFLTCFFLDVNTGWAAGHAGTIVKTTDGGQNWFTQSISTSDHIHSIFFTDLLNGWIVLYEFVPERHGTIMHTTNGGQTWTTQLTEWGFTLHRILFTDANNGYALGSNGILYKTTNGGQNWNDISPFNSYWLYSAFYFNPTEGWVGGGLEGYLLRTINGGQSWSYIGLPTNERMMSLYFVNENYGWACGATGKIIRTTNYGLDWSLANSGVNVELRDLRFINENEGWSVGLNGTILHTIDAGANWFQQTSSTNNNLYGVYFADNQQGWAVGDNGIILKTDNGGIPVELVSFTAEIINNKINLKWSTATEINNFGFEIERGSDLNNFVTIGFQEGKGTTTQKQDYIFVDDLFGVSSSHLYYRLKQIDYDGSFEYSEVVEIEVKKSAKFELDQNYPNPFNPTTKIIFTLALDSIIKLTVFDVLGQEIKTLINSDLQMGYHEVLFSASNLNSGTYFYKLEAVGNNGLTFSSIKKMIFLK